MARYIAFSGGVESTTMCLLYGKGAKAIWCDTGAEHKEMYERIDFCEQRLKDIHNGEFEIIRVRAKLKAKGKIVDNLLDYILQYQFMPTVSRRYCTDKFKIKPIDDFLKSQGECELMIGFNADEEPGKDRTGNLMRCENVKYTYPLFVNGIDRSECESILIKHGLHPNFPIYMKRGGCFMCIFKDKPQYKAMYLFDRSTFDKVEKFEEAYQGTRKRFFPIMAHKGISMKDIRGEVENEILIWGRDEVEMMYRDIKENKPCGAFCHR
jgi:hypothetical protein